MKKRVSKKLRFGKGESGRSEEIREVMQEILDEVADNGGYLEVALSPEFHEREQIAVGLNELVRCGLIAPSAAENIGPRIFDTKSTVHTAVVAVAVELYYRGDIDALAADVAGKTYDRVHDAHQLLMLAGDDCMGGVQ